jgi:hypothetical protein
MSEAWRAGSSVANYSVCAFRSTLHTFTSVLFIHSFAKMRGGRKRNDTLARRLEVVVQICVRGGGGAVVKMVSVLKVKRTKQGRPCCAKQSEAVVMLHRTLVRGPHVWRSLHIKK